MLIVEACYIIVALIPSRRCSNAKCFKHDRKPCQCTRATGKFRNQDILKLLNFYDAELLSYSWLVKGRGHILIFIDATNLKLEQVIAYDKRVTSSVWSSGWFVVWSRKSFETDHSIFKDFMNANWFSPGKTWLVIWQFVHAQVPLDFKSKMLRFSYDLFPGLKLS